MHGSSAPLICRCFLVIAQLHQVGISISNNLPACSTDERDVPKLSSQMFAGAQDGAERFEVIELLGG